MLNLTHSALLVVLDSLDHVTYGDEVPCCLLGEYDHPVHGDIEDPVVSLDELRSHPKPVLNGCRQPDGTRKVVSRLAVCDRDLHTPIPGMVRLVFYAMP